MLLFRLVLLPLCALPLPALADTAQEVASWYRTQYAPLWADSRHTKAEDIVRFYAEGHRHHPANAAPTTSPNTVEAWRDALSTFVADGWRGGELKTIHVETLNERSALVRTRWNTHIKNGQSVETCDFYVAAKFDQGWKFTNHVDVACKNP